MVVGLVIKKPLVLQRVLDRGPIRLGIQKWFLNQVPTLVGLASPKESPGAWRVQ